MDNLPVAPADLASSQNATRDGGHSGRWRTMATQHVAPAGQASQDGGDSHPTVVNIELRQASDGAWYPLVAQEGEPSFASLYVDSAQYFFGNCVQHAREKPSLFLSLLERPSGQSNLAMRRLSRAGK